MRGAEVGGLRWWVVEGAVDKSDGRKQGDMLSSPPPPPNPPRRRYVFQVVHECVLGKDSKSHKDVTCVHWRLACILQQHDLRLYTCLQMLEELQPLQQIGNTYWTGGRGACRAQRGGSAGFCDGGGGKEGGGGGARRLERYRQGEMTAAMGLEREGAVKMGTEGSPVGGVRQEQPLVRALEASVSMLRWLTSMMGRCCFTYPDTRCPACHLHQLSKTGWVKTITATHTLDWVNNTP